MEIYLHDGIKQIPLQLNKALCRNEQVARCSLLRLAKDRAELAKLQNSG